MSTARSSAQNAPPLQLDNLPTEIQDLIFDYVVSNSTRSELKLFRQSNRYFRDRADTHLFRTLHVSASTLSLARIKSISDSPHLSPHVRELVFHRGTFTGHKLVRYRNRALAARDYGDFEEYMIRGEPGFRPSQSDMMRVSACFVAFEEEVRAETEFNREMSWQVQLKQYCSRFGGLEALRTVSDTEDLKSEYLRRRCGVMQQSWTPNYFAPYEIFEVGEMEFRPKALWLDAVNGEDFAAVVTGIGGGVERVKERFAGLRELKISFSETVANLGVEGTYDVFVAACTGLRSLSLDFSSFYSTKILKDPDCLPQKLIGLVLKQRFERLGRLELVYPFMLEMDFIVFLREHVSSLRSVKIVRWPMPVTPDGESTGSIIRALWSIGQIDFKYMTSFIVEDECSNTKTGDGWTITHAKEDELAFATLMHQYLNRQQPYAKTFPIALDFNKMAEAKTGPELALLDELPHKLGCGDDSFAWSGSGPLFQYLTDRPTILGQIEPWE